MKILDMIDEKMKFFFEKFKIRDILLILMFMHMIFWTYGNDKWQFRFDVMLFLLILFLKKKDLI